MSRIERYKTKNKTYWYEKKTIVEISLHEAFPEEADAETYGDGRRDQEPYVMPDCIMDAEQFIMDLSPTEVTFMIYTFLGYSPVEIRRFMGLGKMADVNIIELSLRDNAAEFFKGAF